MRIVVTIALALLLPGAEPDDSSDEAGFPGRYREDFHVLRVLTMDEQPRFGIVYENDRAASIESPAQLPYPYGSVIVMEWRNAVEGPDGKAELDPKGNPRQGDVVRVDVMRRKEGFGGVYGMDRAGEWEFSSYRPDGTELVAPAASGACARCHAGAGPRRDFVFRGRFPEQSN